MDSRHENAEKGGVSRLLALRIQAVDSLLVFCKRKSSEES